MIRSRNEIPLTSRAANYTLVLVMLSRETTDDVAVSFLQPRTRTRDDSDSLSRSPPRASLPPPPLFSTFQPAPEFARFYFQITLARNSPRNCCHFSRKRAIMQAKPACKHFIFQPVAFLPFETPESGSPDPSRAITISSPPPIRMELLKFLLGGGTIRGAISNCYFFSFQ